MTESLRPDPTFHPSPRLAMEAEPEHLCYTALLSPDRSRPDAIAVVDVHPGSRKYGQVLKLLQRLQREKGLSYLLITHDVDVIWAMAHDVLVMKDGRILESGTVEQVLQHPKDPYTQTLVAAAA